MIVVGIVGGIACGKSAVAREFESLGAVCIDADQIGHEVLKQDDTVQSLVRRWGRHIVEPSTGGLIRSAIAKIVFGEDERSKQELNFLESISHPRIAEKIEKQISLYRAQNKAMVVLDAALLIKAGWASLCDFIVYVDVDRPTRLERAKRRGWSEQEYDRREEMQTPLALKRQMADILIDNSQGLDETRIQVRRIWDRLVD